ncbi:type ISP restriction/modification enzyme [Streptomyces sp. NPDC093252]|uniref:type ISP restriction/modification enzyme n=1 Tax=Streptomyces sp. NPDC093252 TaxID=3154980 RepID=UPI00342D395C
MRSVPNDDTDAPPLADLMPWSVAPPRLGRSWPAGPDPASLRARWDALLTARGPDRETLFEPTRARTAHSAVGQLPGHPGGAERLVRAEGPCPEPVRALVAPFDEQWLIPDQRLIDAARPELWRIADDRQVFVTETPTGPGPLLLATTLFPVLRTGRVRPLFRRPGGREPNLAPGLTEYLGTRLGGTAPEPVDVLAWILSAVRADLTVPLTGDPARWALGVASGRRALWLMRRDGERPKLPGGRRPYVRAPLPARPGELRYDRDEETLYLGEGRISPVPVDAWDFEAGGVRVLEEWFLARTGEPEPGTLSAIRPASWPQSWTSELLELITVLALLADLPPLPDGPVPSPVTTADLRAAGVVPVPASARRPASVLDVPEEGPEGQLALI